MGCLLFKPKKLQQLESSTVKRKILLVGLDGAGKTSILYRLKLSDFIQTVSTVGLNVETIVHKNLELLVFDVGGQARTLWSYYFDNLDALIFVIDSTDKARLKIVREEILRISEGLKDNKYVMLLYFNKQDRDDKMDFGEMVENCGVNELKYPVDVIVQKCSALKGDGLIDGLNKLGDYLLQDEKPDDKGKSPEKGEKGKTAGKTSKTS